MERLVILKNLSIKEVFDAYPVVIKGRLQEVRELIFEVAAQTDQVGQVEETLKWGEPSYLTSESGSGTTIRISSVKNQPDKFGIYFNCQTTLLDDFRQQYPDEFEFNGKRALFFKVDQPLPLEPLKHCIAQALTYHLRKKRSKIR